MSRELEKRVKNLVDTRFFTPDVFAAWRLQTSSDPSPFSPARKRLREPLRRAARSERVKNLVDTGISTPEVCAEAPQTSADPIGEIASANSSTGVSAQERFDMTGMTSVIPVIIPSYEPDERLISLLEDFRSQGIRDVIIVNDGSGDRYDEIFGRVRAILDETGGTLLSHDVNRGKGRALKTGFSYVLKHYPSAVGVVTADSDGQHSTECILSVMKKLREKPDSLVLGVRTFDQEDVPWKSAFGNKLTMKILGYVSGVSVSDTQTGLRGIPRSFMRELLHVPGERFEFETQMLLETAGKYEIEEVPIRTIYDSKENHQTHFNPLKDSVRIYRILGAKFFKYIFASLSSCAIDLVLFALFCRLLRGRNLPLHYVAVSTVLARILSAAYNFTVNYKVVFRSRQSAAGSAAKYVLLALVQMSLSALLVTGGTLILPAVPEVGVKAAVDTVLFLISYYVQRRFIF